MKWYIVERDTNIIHAVDDTRREAYITKRSLEFLFDGKLVVRKAQ